MAEETGPGCSSSGVGGAHVVGVVDVVVVHVAAGRVSDPVAVAGADVVGGSGWAGKASGAASGCSKLLLIWSRCWLGVSGAEDVGKTGFRWSLANDVLTVGILGTCGGAGGVAKRVRRRPLGKLMNC